MSSPLAFLIGKATVLPRGPDVGKSLVSKVPSRDQSKEGPRCARVQQQSEALRGALAVLTPHERQAIEAAFFSELTYAEVAASLDQPLGTIKTRIRSGLQKLRQALAKRADKP